jgi:hypothetical protein
LLALLSPKFGVVGVLCARILSSIVVITLLQKKIGFTVIGCVNPKMLVYWIFSSLVMYFVVIFGPCQLILDISWGGALLSIFTGALFYCFLNMNYVSQVVLPFLFKNYTA